MRGGAGGSRPRDSRAALLGVDAEEGSGGSRGQGSQGGGGLMAREEVSGSQASGRHRRGAASALAARGTEPAGGNPAGTRDWFRGKQLLTTCWATQFLTGHRPVPVRGPGNGDPGTRRQGDKS